MGLKDSERRDLVKYRLEKSYGKTYELLLNMRKKGDYDDWIDIAEEDVILMVEPAQKFIEEMKRLINTK